MENTPEIEKDLTEEQNNQVDSNDIKNELVQKTKEIGEYMDLLQRKAAEFDNYRKRVTKEREMLRDMVISEVIEDILPIIDNLETAYKSCADANKQIAEGIELIIRQFKAKLVRYNISEIETVGKNFNPEYHEAVAHIEDSNYGENEIIEEVMKGYKCGDRVIRPSMVKVAN